MGRSEINKVKKQRSKSDLNLFHNERTLRKDSAGRIVKPKVRHLRSRRVAGRRRAWMDNSHNHSPQNPPSQNQDYQPQPNHNQWWCSQPVAIPRTPPRVNHGAFHTNHMPLGGYSVQSFNQTLVQVDQSYPETSRMYDVEMDWQPECPPEVRYIKDPRHWGAQAAFREQAMQRPKAFHTYPAGVLKRSNTVGDSGMHLTRYGKGDVEMKDVRRRKRKKNRKVRFADDRN